MYRFQKFLFAIMSYHHMFNIYISEGLYEKLKAEVITILWSEPKRTNQARR